MSKRTYSSSDKLILFLATGFCAGHAPKAPGTVGTIVAIAPLLLLQQLTLVPYILVVAFACVAGIYLCHKADELLHTHDNKSIVWDEFCGLWITFIAVPSGWITLLAGFVLFRFFDIIKPWPISVADRKVTGGLGVMLDDIIAGMFALVILHTLLYHNLLPTA